MLYVALEPKPVVIAYCMRCGDRKRLFLIEALELPNV